MIQVKSDGIFLKKTAKIFQYPHLNRANLAKIFLGILELRILYNLYHMSYDGLVLIKRPMNKSKPIVIL